MAKNKVNEKEVEEVEEEVVEDIVENENLNIDDLTSEKEIEDLTISLARLQADFVNYKRRTEKEKKDYIAYGIEGLVCEILPILDNFQRAMDSESDKESSFFKGVEMILNQLKTLLTNNGIEEISDLGSDFDPHIHNAIQMEESEEYEEGKVIAVLQKGYRFKEKIIRPSMVIVSK